MFLNIICKIKDAKGLIYYNKLFKLHIEIFKFNKFSTKTYYTILTILIVQNQTYKEVKK